MTNATHTPAPWTNDENCAGRILGPDGIAICSVYGSAARAQQDDCNQMLIAAAPDLLAALEDTVEALTEARYYPSELKRFRAAIAKAKGENGQ